MNVAHMKLITGPSVQDVVCPPRDPETERFNVEALDIIIDNFGKRGALLVLDWDRKNFVTGTFRIFGETIPPFPIDKSVTDRVVASGIPIFNDGHGIMCIPMLDAHIVVGVIYVEREDSKQLDSIDEWTICLFARVLAGLLGRLRYLEWLESQGRRLYDKRDGSIDHQMVGDSAAMQEIYDLIGRLSRVDSTVLITGDSGTGKEMVAKAIHKNSARAAHPFVGFNCGGLAETLLESELFGCEKGAYSGADRQRIGYFEAAQHGVIFLDEIGEMRLAAQAVLLRILQEKEFRRLGGTHLIKTDVRVIAATNRNLEEAVAKGEFRKDLFHRLNVVSIKMPALTDRREDIPQLVLHFIEQLSHLRKVSGITESAMRLIMDYPWPGNVRELKNAVERGLVVGGHEFICPRDLPDTIFTREPDEDDDEPISYHHMTAQFQRALIIYALDRTNHNVTEAAKQLMLNYRYLYRLMKDLGIPLSKSGPTKR